MARLWNVKDKSPSKSTKSLLTIVGRQVLSLNKICRCSDSLSKMWSLGPLFREHNRHRSVNAVKLRSSGSVIAKHLMRRSRRQELSMYTAVVLGWRETGSTSHVAGAGVGEASLRRCVRGALGPALAPGAPLPPPAPHAAPPCVSRAGPAPPLPQGGVNGKRQFSHLASQNACLSICN